MEKVNKYNPEQYLRLVEQLHDAVLEQYMKDEVLFINNALQRNNYDVIDLGAGYGRIISRIIKRAKSVTAIELNEDMFSSLVICQKNVDNVSCLKNDITKLSEYLDISKFNNTLFLLCQNTLGVIEGDYEEMLKEIKELAKTSNVEIIFSVFNKEVLKNYGLSLYEKLREMVGDVDLEKTNYEAGEFVSETGYNTKWWSKSEIYEFKDILNATLIDELTAKEYSLYHFQILPE